MTSTDSAYGEIDATDRVAFQMIEPLAPERSADGTRTSMRAMPPPIPVAALGASTHWLAKVAAAAAEAPVEIAPAAPRGRASLPPPLRPPTLNSFPVVPPPIPAPVPPPPPVFELAPAHVVELESSPVELDFLVPDDEPREPAPDLFAPIDATSAMTTRFELEPPRAIPVRAIAAGVIGLAVIAIVFAATRGGSSAPPASISHAETAQPLIKSEPVPVPVSAPATATATVTATVAVPATATAAVPAAVTAPATVAVAAPAPAHRSSATRATHTSSYRGTIVSPWPTSAPAPARSHRVAVAAPATTAPRGTLMINTKPPCQIVLDGKPTHLVTPQRAFPVAAGNHVITFVDLQKKIRGKVAIRVDAQHTTKLIRDYMR